MDLDYLSTKEKLYLGMKAQQACAEYVRRLTGPDDSVAADVLASSAAEAQDHAADIARVEENADWPAIWRLGGTEIARIVRTHLPSLERSARGMPIAAAAAVEEELRDFYRLLERATHPMAPQEFFHASADRADARLRRLHEAAVV